MNLNNVYINTQTLSNAVSEAKSNRSESQTHVSKHVHFNSVQKMNNLMEHKRNQLFSAIVKLL